MVDAGAAVDLAKRWITAPPLQESGASSGSVDRSIPAPGARGTVTVTERLTLDTGISFTEYVDIEVDFDHMSFRDMNIELESPSGAVSKLAVPYNTRHLVDDQGGTLYIRLDGAFRFGSARHLGEDPNGEWKLHLTDTIAPRGGAFRSWSIKVYGHSGTPALPAGPKPCGAAVTDKSNEGLLADCNALLTARDTLRGTAALNWAADTSIATWDGITLGGSPSRVTGVQLHRRELSGQIPAAIGRLTMLEQLWLYTNELSGAIPGELGNLTNLAGLFVSDNNLSGADTGEPEQPDSGQAVAPQEQLHGLRAIQPDPDAGVQGGRRAPRMRAAGSSPNAGAHARARQQRRRQARVHRGQARHPGAKTLRVGGDCRAAHRPTRSHACAHTHRNCHPDGNPNAAPRFARHLRPVDGSIKHDPDDGLIEAHPAPGVTTADAIIEARFYNPYPGDQGNWSSGFLFRLPRFGRFHAVIITDHGLWYHILASGSDRERLAVGYSEHIDVGATGSNFIRVLADGDDGSFSSTGAM